MLELKSKSKKKPGLTTCGRISIPPAVKSSPTGGGFAILHIGTGQFHLCFGATAEVWRAIRAGLTPSEIAAQLNRESAVPLGRAHTATDAILAELERRNLIVAGAERQRLPSSALLIAGALLEFILYDVRARLFGFSGAIAMLDRVPRHAAAEPAREAELVARVVRAVATAATLYWSHAQCLQRSIAVTRLLRRYGLSAKLAIGYRMDPFISHAWVEVDGRVVNDASGLQRQLNVLHRI
jgi:hypothetical protein